MKLLYVVIFMAVFSSCMKRKYADLVIHNAVIHVLDENNSTGEAMAVRDGKVLEVGPERQILNKYRWGKSIDAQKKHIYPGFTDAHTHLFSLAKQNLGVDLTQCRSIEDMNDSISNYSKIKKRHFILGRGWNQTTWPRDAMPTNDRLSELFPDIPVALYRIDGHALLVNDALLEQIKDRSPFMRASFETGLFIDDAMAIPEAVMRDYDGAEYRAQLLEIQQQLLHFGITSVHEAGISDRFPLLGIGIGWVSWLLDFSKSAGSVSNKFLYPCTAKAKLITKSSFLFFSATALPDSLTIKVSNSSQVLVEFILINSVLIDSSRLASNCSLFCEVIWYPNLPLSSDQIFSYS